MIYIIAINIILAILIVYKIIKYKKNTKSYINKLYVKMEIDGMVIKTLGETIENTSRTLSKFSRENKKLKIENKKLIRENKKKV